MPGFARGQFMVDYEQRCDLDALRRKRVEKAQRAMREQGIDALLMWKVENTRYLSSLRASFLAHREAIRSAVLLTQTGRPHVLTNGGEIPRIKRDMPWIEAFHHLTKLEEQPLMDKLVTQTLRPLLKDLRVTGGKLAIDAMSFIQFSAYSRLLKDVELVNGDSFMHKVRRIKLPEEIYMIREACAIADAVNQEAMDQVKAGRRECDVAAAAMKVLHHYGGEMAHLVSPFVASGEHMSPPTRFATDKIIRSGDLVFIDIGAQWNGYFGDVARTVICGKPSRRQKEIYTAVHESLQKGLERMRPGFTNKQIAHDIWEAGEKYGLKKNWFALSIGHALGTSPNEPPYIGEPDPDSEEVPMTPGLVFAVEPLIWVPDVVGGGGARIEETVLITEDGNEVLTRSPMDDRLLL
ncbi:MAG: hypothetical protein A3J27_05405 [Candidatus Tectomicrobia bacterium RIFCSPLOWO2_12_FULL_69_37]|nr:MAG: hypothetical protein A3J27_05405 [Candidatus Tectomicrobia bacterium RIFCSPLOWO2_12_FULL_69_37]